MGIDGSGVQRALAPALGPDWATNWVTLAKALPLWIDFYFFKKNSIILGKVEFKNWRLYRVLRR